MSDSTSASLFARMLEIILEPDPATSPRDLAISVLQESEGYDFGMDEMGVYDLLARHDLVRRGQWDPRWECWDNIYAHEDGFDEATPIPVGEEVPQ